MSTHNICFHGEIRKIFTGYPPLSRPMHHLSEVLLKRTTTYVFVGKKEKCQTLRLKKQAPDLELCVCKYFG